ncbi:MAG: helix-turn-helix transcriptional regulator [Patescibacteria group bacterium]|jgi:transcriptional regulator with XRE-family HTH domain
MDDNYFIKIGERVKEFREKNNLSQRQLSKKSKVDYSTINRLESRKSNNITVGTLLKLSKALKIKMANLVRD